MKENVCSIFSVYISTLQTPVSAMNSTLFSRNGADSLVVIDISIVKTPSNVYPRGG